MIWTFLCYLQIYQNFAVESVECSMLFSFVKGCSSRNCKCVLCVWCLVGPFVYFHTSCCANIFRLNDSLHVIFDRNNMFLLWKAREMRLSFDFVFELSRIAWCHMLGKSRYNRVLHAHVKGRFFFCFVLFCFVCFFVFFVVVVFFFFFFFFFFPEATRFYTELPGKDIFFPFLILCTQIISSF